MNFHQEMAATVLNLFRSKNSFVKTLSAVGIAGFAAASHGQNTPDPQHPGKAIYDNTCAVCHAAPTDPRTPNFATLTAMTADQLSSTMAEGGKMAPMAAGLLSAEKAQLTAYLMSGQVASAENWSTELMCPADKRSVNVNAEVISAGFHVDQNQTRNFSAKQAGISKAEMADLEVAWAISFPRQGAGTGTSVLGDTVYVTGGGRLMALDAESGCAKWSIDAATRNTPAIGEIDGRKVVAVSVRRDILVVDAATGETIWQADGQASDNVGSIRGGVVIHDNKVIVPISASGVAAGMRATFECCVGHGAVVALSGKDGSKLWEYHTMPTATYNGRVSSTGVKQRGPSGAPIWSYPVIDAKRNRVIVTTGENTSHPGTHTSDAVIALNLDTGKEEWYFQAMPLDIWNMACSSSPERSGPNCPWNIDGDELTGRDFDFGAGAIIAKGANGKDIILAGQKSGDTWALDAENGKLIWNVRFGEGTALGGIHWGITTDGERLFAAINDPAFGESETAKPGMFAVDIKSGKTAWEYDAVPNCVGERGELVSACESRYGFSAAPITIDGAVVGATLGGEVFIFDSKTGEVMNQIDTVKPFETLNSIEGKGGSIDSHAISAGAGMIFINSGYGSFGQTPGNVLIAYKAKK